MRGMLAGAVCCAAVCRAGGTGSAGSPADGRVSRFSRKPQAQTACDGVRVDRYGFCWVLSETPPFFPDRTRQEGNANPREKVRIKSAKEISFNYVNVQYRYRLRTRGASPGLTESVHLFQ